MSIVAKATEYAKNGLSIHLLYPKAKNPMNNGWSKAPFMNEVDLVEEFKKNPNANIGIRLGECSKIGSRYLYVLDLDISSDDPMQIKEAYDTLKAIYKDYDKLPCVRSASKNSRHFYFLSKILLKTKKLAHSSGKITVKVNGEDKVKNNWEIDLCSTGKQVVIPPSVFNGNTYAWERDLLTYLNSEAQKALMIIDDMSLITLSLENDPQAVNTDNNIDKTKVYKISEIKKYLDKLPSNFYDNYDDWLHVGMALHHTFDDTEDEQEAIQLFDEFSKKSDKYEKGAAYKKWKTFEKKEDGYTLGTIFYHCPKETTDDKIANFSKFLSDEKVNFKTLKDKLAECDLKDYELEGFIDLIAVALSTPEKKIAGPTARKIIKGLQKEIEEDKDEELDKLAIGLDDTLATMILKEHFNDGKHLLNLNNNLFTYRHGVWQKQELAVLEKTVLNGIKHILQSNKKEYDSIKQVIFKKRKNDDIDGLTNKITSLILKMVATPEADDILNLKNKSEIKYSVVNTLNKEIYIQNGKITVEDHKYDSYLISQMNVHYDPNETCPNWDRMFDKIFQKYADKEEVKRHMYEVLGYIIQSKKKEPLFLLIVGSGKNSKSFLMSEFSKVMGMDSTLNVEMKKFSEGAHAETALVGKNMIIDDDWKKGQLIPDDYIKKLSENKMLTANPKFKEQFNFVSRATPVILANSSPKSKDTSFGMERRAHVFNFNYQFQDNEIDRRLDEKLQAERSGFLNKILNAYIEFEKRGGYFKVPMSVKKATQEWLKGSNPLLAFLDEKIIITKDPSDKVKAQGLFDSYNNYCQNENMSHALTRNNFYDDLKNINGLSVKKDSSDKNMYIYGAKLK